ncbi:Sister chromatid cohesion 1 protein 4 [Picochlorum sp. SENEW3]|nr:Sister chromatid cohesion 1 protein 4 [Picochlorum sp. SENEW3]
MFYSSQLLSRKTPLGICWIASHSESKRLKRTQVFEFSISQSCDSIINPEAPLALRLSGQLLLGVVRIYQRKLTFLEADAKNAIDGLQRKEGTSQNVDLPDGGTAPENAITLPGSDPTVFKGTNGDLFPSFHISSTPGLGTGGSGSLARLSGGTDVTMADDISDVFGSTRWTASEDRFELDGSLDKQFSTELERLRSAVDVDTAPGDTGLFYDGGDDFGPMDDIMEAPGAELFEAPSVLVDPSKTPGSVGHFSEMLKASPSGGMSPGMNVPDDFDMDDYGGGGGDDYYDDGPLPPSTPVAPKPRKKKTFHLDLDADGDPCTFLDDSETKKLLRNRAPLMKTRGIVADDAAAAEESYTLASITYVAPDIAKIINPIIHPPKPVRERAAKRDKNETDNAPADDTNPFEIDHGDGGGMDDYGGDYGDDDFGGGYDDMDDMDVMQTPVSDADVEKAILTHDGFTARTQSVMKHIRHRLEPSPGEKRPHEESSSTRKISLDSLVSGKSRLEACRWFFESLVLRNKGFLDLEQSSPYGPIQIVPLDKMDAQKPEVELHE